MTGAVTRPRVYLESFWVCDFVATCHFFCDLPEVRNLPFVHQSRYVPVCTWESDIVVGSIFSDEHCASSSNPDSDRVKLEVGWGCHQPAQYEGQGHIQQQRQQTAGKQQETLADFSS